MSDRQHHEFKKRHIWETQLTTDMNDWVKILDKGGQVDTFILDFEKAFDTQQHELLKSKLFGYGIGGKTLRWIESFLCYRTQRWNFGVGSSIVRCPTRDRSWSIIVLSVHKCCFYRHRPCGVWSVSVCSNLSVDSRNIYQGFTAGTDFQNCYQHAKHVTCHKVLSLFFIC